MYWSSWLLVVFSPSWVSRQYKALSKCFSSHSLSRVGSGENDTSLALGLALSQTTIGNITSHLLSIRLFSYWFCMVREDLLRQTDTDHRCHPETKVIQSLLKSAQSVSSSLPSLPPPQSGLFHFELLCIIVLDEAQRVVGTQQSHVLVLTSSAYEDMLVLSCLVLAWLGLSWLGLVWLEEWQVLPKTVERSNSWFCSAYGCHAVMGKEKEQEER